MLCFFGWMLPKLPCRKSSFSSAEGFPAWTTGDAEVTPKILLRLSVEQVDPVGWTGPALFFGRPGSAGLQRIIATVRESLLADRISDRGHGFPSPLFHN